jgi:ribonuclease E
VRELTLQSTAPCLVYEEGNLIKRSIRDLYAKDIDDILVAGEAAYEEAADFMRMLSPGQVKNVIKYEEPEPLFARFQIERQLNAMFSPYVTLKSGGYLVINQTEALVSIDVNSGKATREFSIEETALNTNLEAAEEIARQLKLRDLAGLIVIDFIDMEERRNNRKVEGRLKDALRHDRARIQVGRISHFGLLEMSRQRLRTGVLEGSTSQCPHCQGTGIVRSVESVALAVLRALEDQLLRDARNSLTAVTTADVALYILNNKRAFVTDMERRYGVTISVQASDRMQGANFAIERAAARPAPQRQPDRGSTAVNMEWGFEGQEGGEEADEDAAAPASDSSEREGSRRGRRRRRRGRRDERADDRPEHRDRRTGNGESADVVAEGAAYADDMPPADDLDEPAGLGEQPSLGRDEEGREERRGRRRRRGRRGGRRGRDRDGTPRESGEDLAAQEGDDRFGGNGREQGFERAGAEPYPHPARTDEFSASGESAANERPEPDQAGPAPPESATIPDLPASREPDDRTRRPPARTEEPPAPAGATSREPEPAHAEYAGEPSPEEPQQPARRGWWQRRFTGE